jgi:PKD repeat protein
MKFSTLPLFLFFLLTFSGFSQGCPFPTSVNVTQRTASTLTVDWIGAVNGNFQIRWAIGATGLNTAPVVNVNTKPFTITGLNQNTTYAIQVRDSCGPGNNFSFWSVSANGTTLCEVNAPFLTNFDGAAWNLPTFGNQNGSINVCWNRDLAPNTRIWRVGPPGFVFNSGATNDHTTGNGQYMFVDNVGFTTGSVSTNLESPIYNLNPISNPQLVFWYHMFGTDIEDLNVYISTDGGSTYTLETTISGQQQTSTTDAWKERVVDLSAYANQRIRIKFEAFESTAGFNNAICIDDVQLRAAPSCPRPQSLNLISLGSTSATVGFTSGGASNWNLQIGPTGFTLGSGTISNSSVNPATLSGLTPNTSYDVYVRDSCGPGDVSVWEGPLTFTTACAPLVAPFTENFDGNTFNPGPGFNDQGTINNCWSRSLGNNYFWKAGPPTFTPTNTGPSGDNTSGNGGYMFMESNGFSSQIETDDLESPLIDLSPLTAPELTFFTHMFGADISALRVFVDAGNGYVLVNTQTGQQQNSKTASWKEVIVDLGTYANDTVRIKWEGERSATGFDGDIAIDDVSIAEAPSCPKPQNVAVNGVGTNSATLSWTSGGATNWQFSFGVGTINPANGTIVSVNSNPGTLSGLSPNTSYQVFVRDSCAPGDVSAWSSPITFTTRCLPASAPYTQNFDASGFTLGNFNTLGNFDACYSRPTGSNYEWSVADDDNFSTFTGPSADHTTGSGQYLLSTNLFSGGLAQSSEAIFSTELIDLSPLNVPEMAFWYHMYGNQIDSLAVYLDNGTSTTRVFGISGQQQTANTAAWQEATVNISAFANDTISVEFRAYRANNFAQAEIAIDDFSIYEQPSCPKPSNLALSGSSSNSITLSWTTGGSANWQIEYGPAGFTKGTGTVVGVSTNPYTITGLSPATAYDVYVQDSCAPGDVSFWVGPVTGRTACAPVAAPLLETFDGSVFTPGLFFNDPGSLDPCWSRSDSTGYLWRPESGLSSVFNSGPNADNTTGSGQYILSLLRGSGFNSNTSTQLTSLEIDLSTLVNPELRFFNYRFGGAIDQLEVEIWDGTTWTTELTLNGQLQTQNTDPWEEQIVSLASYTNDTIQVRFTAERPSGFNQDIAIAIDDFEIRQTPTCPKPTALTATASNSNSITLSWTSGGATNWQVFYRPAGSSTPFTQVNTSTNPFTITGLNASTTYEIEVKDSCGVNDISLASNTLLASTNCGVVTAPYFEGFDGPSWVVGNGFQNQNNQIDPCWSRPNANAPNFGTNQGNTGSAGTGPSQDASGNGKYVYTEFSGSPTGPGTITTPSIFIPANLQSPQFKFAYHMYGTFIIDLKVSMSVNGGPFNSMVILTGPQQTSNVASWLRDSVSLASNIGDTLRFRFEGSSSGFRGDIAIDEVAVEGTPVPCAQVTNLSLQNPGTNSLEASWTSLNTNALTNLSYYEISAGPISATTVSGVSSPYTITNLLAGSTYVVAVFDSCGSAVATPQLDTLATLPCPTVTANYTSTANFLNVNFNSTSTNADSLQWTLGTIGSSNQLNPAITFPGAGTYTVTLEAYNNCGNADTLVRTITVCDTLVADFSFSYQGDSILFSSAQSQNAVGFIWDLDEGQSSTQANPTVKYNSNGQKTVSLSVFNNCGDTVSISKTVDVCPPPVAEWTYNILPPTGSGLRIQFDGTLSTGANSYNWDFGDGNTGTGATPVHIYSTPNLLYVVELEVTNACGNKATRRFALNELSQEEWKAGPELTVYPNPATAEVTVEWNTRSTEPQRISIINLNGALQKQVLVQNALAGRQTVALEGLASGLYLIRVSHTKGTEQFKLRVR